MAKAGRKRSYESYKNQYKTKQRKLNANGVQMNQRMLTEREFEAQYTRLLNQRKQEVSEGKRKTTGNITRDIIDKQAYSMSTKQIDAILKDKREELSKKYNAYQLRSGEWMEIEMAFERQRYEDYGWDEEEINRAIYKSISTEFFGS